MGIKGIDVSKWQGDLTIRNYQIVKSKGYNFVIIKMGGNNLQYYEDSKFSLNLKNAREAGLDVGLYYYLAAEFNAVRIVNHFLELYIKAGRPTIDYPIFFDVEEGNSKLREKRTENLVRVLESLEALKFFVGIYGSEHTSFRTLLDKDKISNYCWWVANWRKEPELEYGIWQNSNNLKLTSWIGAVDTNISKYDYANIIRKGHFNGY